MFIKYIIGIDIYLSSSKIRVVKKLVMYFEDYVVYSCSRISSALARLSVCPFQTGSLFKI